MSGSTADRVPKSQTSFLNQAIFTLISQVLVFSSGLVLTPIIIKMAGADVYGQYVLMITLASFIVGISNFGIGFSARRYLPAADGVKERRNLFFPQFSATIIAALILALAIFIGGIILSGLLGVNSIQVLFLISYLLGYTLYNMGAEYLRSTHRIVAFNFAALSLPYLYMAIVLTFVFLGRSLDIDLLLAAQVAAVVVIAVMALSVPIGELGFQIRLPSALQLRKDVALGAPLVISYAIDSVLSISDRYVIAAMLTIEQVAFYSIAYVIGSIPLFFVRAASVVLTPRLSRLIDVGDVEVAHALVGFTIRTYLLVSIPFAAGTVALGPAVMTLYATPEAANAAVLALPIIAAASIAYGLFIILTTVLFSQLRTRTILRVNLAAAVINVVLNVAILFFVKDIAVAAGSTLFCYVIVLISTVRKTGAVWFSSITIRDVSKMLFAAAVMAGVVSVGKMLLHFDGDVLQAATLVLIGIVSYGAMLFVLGLVRWSEITGALARSRSGLLKP